MPDRARIKTSDQLGPPRLTVVLDGEELREKKQASSMDFKAADLAQGKHVVIVSASDNGGNVVTDKQTFVVDSTESFGSEAVWRGARGKDVKDLQQRLADAGVFEGTRSGRYDDRTEAAVKDYQGRYGFTVDGRVDGDTLTALGSQIVVDLGNRQLYLYRGDKVFKSYGIAVGQPAYPTPTGSCVIVNKQVDPTGSRRTRTGRRMPNRSLPAPTTLWEPVDRHQLLRDRIHGTPDGWSIGTYASHGCIRMHIPDVEELYTHVVVGMPVLIKP